MNTIIMYVQKHTLDVLLMHLLILTVGNKYRRAILVKHQKRMLHIENLPDFSGRTHLTIC